MSEATRSVLGKGLASLLPGNSSTGMGSGLGAHVTAGASGGIPTNPALATPASDRIPGISMLPVELIKANEFQPRRDFDEVALQELSQSIKENGLIQPLVVRKNGNHYELIAGERRLRASKLAGLKMLPVVVRKSTDREALELAIVENIQREDLNCVDEGLAYFQLMQEFSLSQEELAKKMGKDRATIANALRILKLSDTILSHLKKGQLSRGHAKALLSVEDVQAREKLAKEILDKNLSVRQAEKAAQDSKETGAKSVETKIPSGGVSASASQEELKRFKQELTRKFMTKSEIKGTETKGQLVLHYGSKEELYRLLNQLLS